MTTLAPHRTPSPGTPSPSSSPASPAPPPPTGCCAGSAKASPPSACSAATSPRPSSSPRSPRSCAPSADDVLVAIDEEGGDVTRLEVRARAPPSPATSPSARVDDTDLTRAVARELGRRLAACGVNLNWAPSADVNSNPDNPVIGVRSFGADTATGRPAHRRLHRGAPGRRRRRLHQALPRPRRHRRRLPPRAAPHRRGLDTLHARELVPFRAAIAAGTKAVMSAHILLPALDPDLPGDAQPAILTGSAAPRGAAASATRA